MCILQNQPVLLSSVFGRGAISAGTPAQFSEGKQSLLPSASGSQHGAGGRRWVCCPQCSSRTAKVDWLETGSALTAVNRRMCSVLVDRVGRAL